MATVEVHELFHTVEDGRARDVQELSQEMLSVHLLCSSQQAESHCRFSQISERNKTSCAS
jgi:hypothetical protein